MLFGTYNAGEIGPAGSGKTKLRRVVQRCGLACDADGDRVVTVLSATKDTMTNENARIRIPLRPHSVWVVPARSCVKWCHGRASILAAGPTVEMPARAQGASKHGRAHGPTEGGLQMLPARGTKPTTVRLAAAVAFLLTACAVLNSEAGEPAPALDKLYPGGLHDGPAQLPSATPSRSASLIVTGRALPRGGGAGLSARTGCRPGSGGGTEGRGNLKSGARPRSRWPGAADASKSQPS